MNNNNRRGNRDESEDDDFPHQPRIPDMDERQREDYCYRAFRMIMRQQRQLQRQSQNNHRTERLERENIRLQERLEERQMQLDSTSFDLCQARGGNEGLRRQLDEVRQRLKRARLDARDHSAALRSNHDAANRSLLAMRRQLFDAQRETEHLQEENRRLRLLNRRQRQQFDQITTYNRTQQNLDETTVNPNQPQPLIEAVVEAESQPTGITNNIQSEEVEIIEIEIGTEDEDSETPEMGIN